MDEANSLAPGLLGAFFAVYLLVLVVAYAYIAFCLMMIGKKLNTGDEWWAWIPILNLFYTARLAGKDTWMGILLLVPFVNLLVMLWFWWCISENRGKPGWIGLLLLVPCVNIFVPGYLAFSS